MLLEFLFQTMFEAARAHAIADGRLKVEPQDLQTVAPIALRLRRSEFMMEYFSEQASEEQQLHKLLDETFSGNAEQE